MKNLDWQKINSTKLQRLINDLFCLEANRFQFVHSDPNIGKDKGLDGWYEGIFKYLGVSTNEKYSIQSKWVEDRTPQKTFKKIKQYLIGTKSEIGEIKKAETNGADYLIIGTNGKLNVKDHKLELQKLSEKSKLKGIIVWDSEDLRSIIDLHPYIGYVYFQNPQYPSLVPPKVYFSQTENHLLNIDKYVSYKNFDSEIQRVQTFIESDKLVLGIHSPGGYGKSHFLNLLSQMESNSEWEIWSCKLGYRQLNQVIGEETNTDKKYVFLIDDVDRALSYILPLFQLIATGVRNIKIIMTFRSASRISIYEALKANRLSSMYEEIDISKWNENELITLYKDISKETNDSKIQSIVKKYIVPYILIDFAKRSKRGDKGYDSLMRIYDDFCIEISACLSDLIPNSKTRNELITNIALMIPFSKDDKTAISSLSEATGIDKNTVNKCINILKDTNILRFISNQYRFNPDLKGDIFLSKQFECITEQEVKDQILFWIKENPTNVFNNINGAFNTKTHMSISSVIALLLDEEILKVRNNTTPLVMDPLSLSKLSAFISPEKASDLFESILDFSSNLSTDNTGPVIQALSRTSLPYSRIYDLLLKIIRTNRLGTYDNYKFQGLSKELVSPSYNSLKTIDEALNVLNQWLTSTNLDDSMLNVIEWQLSYLLAISFEYNETWGLTTSFGSWALADKPAVINYRKKAISLLSILYSIDEMRAIRVIDSVGDTSMIAGGVSNLPLKEVAKKEQSDLMRLISLNLPQLEIPDKVKFETFLIHWWAQEKGGEDIAEEILKNMEREPEYIVFRSMIEYEAIIYDFNTFKSTQLSDKALEWQATHSKNSESRWSWYVWLRTDREDLTDEILNQVINTLKIKYKTSEEILKLLINLETFFKKSLAYSTNNRFLQLWVESSPDEFKIVYNNFYESVPSIFKPTLVLSLLNVLPQTEEIVEGILSNPDSYVSGEIEIAISKASYIFSEDKLKLKTIRLINRINRKMLSSLIWSITRIEDKLSQKSIFEIVTALIRRIPMINENELANFDMLLHKCASNGTKLPLKVKSELIHLLLHFPKSSYHMDNLVKLSIANIYDAITFIETRLNTQEEISYLKYPSKVNKYSGFLGFAKKLIIQHKYQKQINFYKDYLSSYDAIDIDGFPNLASLIKNYEEYTYFFNQIIDWQKKDLFFSMDLDKLTDQVILTNDYWVKYIQDLFNKKDIERLLIFLDYLPIKNTSKTLIESLEKIICIDNKYGEKIKNILGSKTLPKGFWSSTVGEAPPQFIELKIIFSDCLTFTTNPVLKAIIDECIKYIESQIQSHICRDEQYLIPK